MIYIHKITGAVIDSSCSISSNYWELVEEKPKAGEVVVPEPAPELEAEAIAEPEPEVKAEEKPKAKK